MGSKGRGSGPLIRQRSGLSMLAGMGPMSIFKRDRKTALIGLLGDTVNQLWISEIWSGDDGQRLLGRPSAGAVREFGSDHMGSVTLVPSLD